MFEKLSELEYNFFFFQQKLMRVGWQIPYLGNGVFKFFLICNLLQFLFNMKQVFVGDI